MQGRKIKELRRSKKFSQEELAQLSGVSRATISFLENDLPQNVELNTLKKLADALDVSIKDFL